MSESAVRQTVFVAIVIALSVVISLLFGAVGQVASLAFWMAVTIVLSWHVALDVGGYPLDIRVLHAVRGALALGLLAVHVWFLFHRDDKVWADTSRGVGLIAVPIFYPYPPILTIRRRRLIKERSLIRDRVDG